MKSSLSVALAGSGGAGVMTAGNMLLEAAAAAGYYGLMTRTSGPQIRGGEAAAMVRIASFPTDAQEDHFHVLAAIDWQNVGRFAGEIPLGADSTTLNVSSSSSYTRGSNSSWASASPPDHARSRRVTAASSVTDDRPRTARVRDVGGGARVRIGAEALCQILEQLAEYYCAQLKESGKLKMEFRVVRNESHEQLEVKLSSADRVLFPQDGITKGDLFEYYRAIVRPLTTFVDRMRKAEAHIATPLLQLHGSEDGCIVPPTTSGPPGAVGTACTPGVVGAGSASTTGPNTIGAPPPAGVQVIVMLRLALAGTGHPGSCVQETNGRIPIGIGIGDAGPGLSTVSGANFAIQIVCAHLGRVVPMQAQTAAPPSVRASATSACRLNPCCFESSRLISPGCLA